MCCILLSQWICLWRTNIVARQIYGHIPYRTVEIEKMPEHGLEGHMEQPLCASFSMALYGNQCNELKSKCNYKRFE